jgi:hypothetical protein
VQVAKRTSASTNKAAKPDQTISGHCSEMYNQGRKAMEKKSPHTGPYAAEACSALDCCQVAWERASKDLIHLRVVNMRLAYIFRKSSFKPTVGGEEH